MFDMWLDNVTVAIQKLNEIIYPSIGIVRAIKPAYDGIVFEMHDGVVYKFWYGDEKITKLRHWRSAQ